MIPPATAIIVTVLMPHPPHTPNKGLLFFLLLLVSKQPSLFFLSLAYFFLFSQNLHLFFPIPNPTACASFPLTLPRFPSEPPPFYLMLSALAACQCLRVSCGHFSFIILSKSGMALAQGDWVSVKHQDLIEFVLKWVIEGTLLMQS